MSIKQIFRTQFHEVGPEWESWIPDEHVSRQIWQEIVESIVDQLRIDYKQVTFGLTAWEVSIYFHQPLGQFEGKLREKLN